MDGGVVGCGGEFGMDRRGGEIGVEEEESVVDGVEGWDGEDGGKSEGEGAGAMLVVGMAKIEGMVNVDRMKMESNRNFIVAKPFTRKVYRNCRSLSLEEAVESKDLSVLENSRFYEGVEDVDKSER